MAAILFAKKSNINKHRENNNVWQLGMLDEMMHNKQDTKHLWGKIYLLAYSDEKRKYLEITNRQYTCYWTRCLFVLKASWPKPKSTCYVQYCSTVKVDSSNRWHPYHVSLLMGLTSSVWHVDTALALGSKGHITNIKRAYKYKYSFWEIPTKWWRIYTNCVQLLLFMSLVNYL